MIWLLVHYQPARSAQGLLFWLVLLTAFFCLLLSLLAQHRVIAAHSNKGTAVASTAMAYQPLKILWTCINKLQKEKQKHLKNSCLLLFIFRSVVYGGISGKSLCSKGYLVVFRTPFWDREPTYMLMNEISSRQRHQRCPTTVSSTCLLPSTLLACAS